MVTVRNFTSELLLNSGQQYCNCRVFFSLSNSYTVLMYISCYLWILKNYQ